MCVRIQKPSGSDGHGLRYFVTGEPGYNCDLCGTEDLPAETPLWGCKQCDYDICERCYVKPRPIPNLHPLGLGQRLFSASNSSR